MPRKKTDHRPIRLEIALTQDELAILEAAAAAAGLTKAGYARQCILSPPAQAGAGEGGAPAIPVEIFQMLVLISSTVGATNNNLMDALKYSEAEKNTVNAAIATAVGKNILTLREKGVIT